MSILQVMTERQLAGVRVRWGKNIWESDPNGKIKTCTTKNSNLLI